MSVGRYTLLVALCVIVAAAVIYWLPQHGAYLTSDVTWIYRMQVTAPDAVPPVPEGLRLFSGAPMGWVEGCVAHFEAFRRLNCGDIVLWRLSALIAGDSAPAWHAISLLINCMTLVVVDAILRRLAMPWPVRALTLIGLLLAPSEIWLNAVTSEPRVGLAVSLAILAAINGRAVLAAIAMSVGVLIKEPTIVWWALIAALSLAPLDRDGLHWRALVPHIVAGTIVLGAGLAIWFLIPARNDYPFMLQSAYSEIASFLAAAWTGLTPVVLRPNGWWVIPLAAATLAIGAIRAGRASDLLRRLVAPNWWLPLVAGIAAIAGHLAVHWVTRRGVGDGRYVMPANVASIIVVALALRPFLLLSSRTARIVALALAVVAVLLQVAWSSQETVLLSATLAAAVMLIAAVALGIARTAGLRAPVAGIAIAGLAAFVAAPRIDERLLAAAEMVADTVDWHDTVTALVTDLPQDAFVALKTSDPLMIETGWGLQGELLFRQRGDVALRLEPRDTAFYDIEDGLVRSAHDAFNADRPTEEEARAAGRPMFTLELDRGGRGASQPRPALSPTEWLSLMVTDPAEFYRQRYTNGRAGYLNSTLRPAPAS